MSYVEGAVGVISAPNPHVFPLLLAMSLDPTLPVRLLPIAESSEADPLFASGEAGGMLAMTYIGAKKRMSGAVPDLRLHSIFTWRGFFEVVPQGVSSFGDLRGKTVIVSGPVGSGKDGGGDVIFKAAASRQGVDPERDLQVEYLPARQGIERIISGQAAGITLPSPSNTGLVMRSRMLQNPASLALSSGIDFQRVFSGFSSFPQGQLPLGGLHFSERAGETGEKRAKLDRIAAAYADAAGRFMVEPDRHAETISSLFGDHFITVGGSAPPAMLLSLSVQAGDLIYRGDMSVAAVRRDLAAWLAELLGQETDAAFLAS